MWRIVLLFALSLLFIAIDYKKRQNGKKTVIALLLLLFIFGVGFSGTILTRAIAPLFFIHLFALLASYLAFIYYLFKEHFLWYIFILPIITITIYIALNYLEGSRYEALNLITTKVLI